MTFIERVREALVNEVSFTFALAGGPGGQNVNKVSTKAIMRWPVHETRLVSNACRERFLEKYPGFLNKAGEVLIASDEFRSQSQNKAACIEKLAAMLQSVSKPPKKRIGTKVPKSAKVKRAKAKQQHSEKKRGRQRPSFDD